LGYGEFARQGFEVVGAFDVDPQRNRPRSIGEDLSDGRAPGFIADANQGSDCDLPGHVAQEVANELVKNGIQAILNFAPAILQVPENVVVNNVDLAAELENLSYFIQ